MEGSSAKGACPWGACPSWVMGGYRRTSAPGPLVSNDRTLPMPIASSGECHYRNLAP